MSARHQVNGRTVLFRGPAEETSFLRSVRVSLTTRNFTGPTPGTKSGPDVFADALVPSGRILPPERPASQTDRFDGRASRHLGHNPSQSRHLQPDHQRPASSRARAALLAASFVESPAGSGICLAHGRGPPRRPLLARVNAKACPQASRHQAGACGRTARRNPVDRQPHRAR